MGLGIKVRGFCLVLFFLLWQISGALAQGSCWQALMKQADSYIKAEKFVMAKKVLEAASGCPDRPKNYRNLIQDRLDDSENQTTETIDKKNKSLESKLKELTAANDKADSTSRQAQITSYQAQLNALINLAQNIEGKDPNMALDLLGMAFNLNKFFTDNYRFRESALRILHNSYRLPAQKIYNVPTKQLAPAFLYNSNEVCYIENDVFLTVKDLKNKNASYTIRTGDIPITDFEILANNQIAVAGQERCALLARDGTEITSFTVPERQFTNIEVTADGKKIYLTDKKNKLMEVYDWTGRCVNSVQNNNTVQDRGLVLYEFDNTQFLIARLEYEGDSETRTLLLNADLTAHNSVASGYKAATFRRSDNAFLVLSNFGQDSSRTQLSEIDVTTGKVINNITNFEGNYTEIISLGLFSMIRSSSKILILNQAFIPVNELCTMFESSEGGFENIAFSTDLQWFVAAEGGSKPLKRLRVWEQNGFVKLQIPPKEDAWYVYATANASGEKIIACCTDNTVHILDMNGSILKKIPFKATPTEALALPAADYMMVRTNDGQLHTVREDKIVYSRPYETNWKMPLSMGDTNAVLMQTANNEIAVVKLLSPEKLRTFSTKGRIRNMRYASFTHELYASSDPYEDSLLLNIFDVETGFLKNQERLPLRNIDFDIWRSSNLYTLQRTLRSSRSEALLYRGLSYLEQEVFLENRAIKLETDQNNFRNPYILVLLDKTRAERYNEYGRLMDYYQSGIEGDKMYSVCFTNNNLVITCSRQEGIVVWNYNHLENVISAASDVLPKFSLEERTKAGYIPALSEVYRSEDPYFVVQGLKYYHEDKSVRKEYTKQDILTITEGLKKYLFALIKKQAEEETKGIQYTSSALLYEAIYTEIDTFITDKNYTKKFLDVLYQSCLNDKVIQKEAATLFKKSHLLSTEQKKKLCEHYAQMLLNDDDIEKLLEFTTYINKTSSAEYATLEAQTLNKILKDNYLYRVNFAYTKIFKLEASKKQFNDAFNQKLEQEESILELTKLFKPSLKSGDDYKSKLIYNKMVNYIKTSDNEYNLTPLYHLNDAGNMAYDLSPHLDERLLQIVIQKNDWATTSYVLDRFERAQNQVAVAKIHNLLYSQVPHTRSLLVLENFYYRFAGQPDKRAGVLGRYIQLMRGMYLSPNTDSLKRGATFLLMKRQIENTNEVLGACYWQMKSAKTDSLLLENAKFMIHFATMSPPELLPTVYYYASDLLKRSAQRSKDNTEATALLTELRINQLYYALDNNRKNELKKLARSLLKQAPTDKRVQILVPTAYMAAGSTRRAIALCEDFLQARLTAEEDSEMPLNNGNRKAADIMQEMSVTADLKNSYLQMAERYFNKAKVPLGKQEAYRRALGR